MSGHGGEDSVEAEPVPALVTVQLWRLPARHVPWAMARVPGEARRVRRCGASFARLMGTGDARTFSPRHPTPRRWFLLAAWPSAPTGHRYLTDGPVGRAWQRRAVEAWRAELRPLASRGRWAGRHPFGVPTGPAEHDGPVAALTRARLARRHARTFRRAVPGVVAELTGAPGLRLALPVGEAPVGLAGTFSVWDSPAALAAFVDGAPAHRAAVARTATVGWYAEELFARFAVGAGAGTVDGRDPLA